MIKELAHFLRQVPGARATRQRMARLAYLDLYESQLDEAGKTKWRASLVTDLQGEVLEIGAGTGTMFPFFSNGVRLTATDPDEDALHLAAGRTGRSAASITLQPAKGESLPFPDALFDAVVSSGVLCSVQSVEKTLAEVKRVLRPGGQFRLIEHVKSDRLISGFLMDVFNPVWRAINGEGCNMNRNPEASLRAAGFAILEIERFQLFADGVPTAFPYRWVKAIAPATEPHSDY